MYNIAVGVLGIVTIACSFPARSEEAKAPTLIYSPWTKFCLGDTCFIGSDARTECATAVGAVVLTRTDDAKKTLRVALPKSINIDRGVRISIDRSQPINRPFTQCHPYVCFADYDAGSELIDQLKQGQTLVVEATDAANMPIRRSLPLLHFSDAYDGPAQQPKVFEQVLSKEQMQAEDERQKREAEERKARCRSDP